VDFEPVSTEWIFIYLITENEFVSNYVIEFKELSTAEIIEDREFVKVVNLFATWASLAQNKTLTPVSFFILVLNQPQLREIICDSLNVNYYRFISLMCAEYPTIAHSKRVLNSIPE
jgi:hypothetical protein